MRGLRPTFGGTAVVVLPIGAGDTGSEQEEEGKEGTNLRKFAGHVYFSDFV
jgi:hypothetical protein